MRQRRAARRGEVDGAGGALICLSELLGGAAEDAATIGTFGSSVLRTISSRGESQKPLTGAHGHKEKVGGLTGAREVFTRRKKRETRRRVRRTPAAKFSGLEA